MTAGDPDHAPTDIPIGGGTELLRALVRTVDDDQTGNLATARKLLADGTSDSERAAMRMIALWAMTNVDAPKAIRAMLVPRRSP